MLSAIEAGVEEPFYVVDLHAALDKLALWRRELPAVEPHYAVKCNSDQALLLALAQAGCNFDCASAAEIDLVIGLDVPPSRIVFAHPVKQPSHLRRAREAGVALTVFDGAHELPKLAKEHMSCALLLRIEVEDSGAQHPLSNKYGASTANAPALLAQAAELGLHVVGVSFHVGSGNTSPSAFYDAVAAAATIFDSATAMGLKMSVLDVGGGFPGVKDEKEMTIFQAMASNLQAALDEFFPRDAAAHRGGVRLIAEPGRYIACTTHHLAVCVIGKKVATREPCQSKAMSPTTTRATVSHLR